MEEFLKSIAGPIFVALISGGLVALFRQARKADELRFQGIEKRGEETRKLIEDHKELCEAIPNSLLLNKLQEIGNKQDYHYANTSQRLDKLEKSVDDVKSETIAHKTLIGQIKNILKI